MSKKYEIKDILKDINTRRVVKYHRSNTPLKIYKIDFVNYCFEDAILITVTSSLEQALTILCKDSPNNIWRSDKIKSVDVYPVREGVKIGPINTE